MLKDGQKSSLVSVAETLAAQQEYTIGPWSSGEAHELFMALEQPNWAPWLAAGTETLAGRARVFPAGQLVMKDMTGAYMGSLSLNQIHWDGDPAHLQSWDDLVSEASSPEELRILKNFREDIPFYVGAALRQTTLPNNLKPSDLVDPTWDVHLEALDQRK